MNNLTTDEIKKVLRYSLILIFLLSLFLAVKTLAEFKALKHIGSDTPPQNVITVKGKGEVFAVPDVAEFSFTVREEGGSVKVAQDKASEKLNEAVNFLKASDVEERDYKTTAYHINPKYEYQTGPCLIGPCPPGRQVIVGYQVSQTITAKVRNTDKVGEIVQGIGDIRVTHLSDFRLTIDDEESLKAEARKLAIEDAKNKAKILSDDLDVKMVRLVTFSESEPFRGLEYGFGGDTLSLPAKLESAPEIPVGENRIVSEVFLTYEIK
jgi:uncharacterized protein